MGSNVEKQELMEQLVQELLKEKPRKKVIQDLALQLEIPFSGDQLTDIDRLLHSMGAVYLRSPRRREIDQNI